MTQYLLRGNIEGNGTQVNLAVRVDARDDEEYSGSTGATFEQTTQTEDNRTLIFLNHLQCYQYFFFSSDVALIKSINSFREDC